MHRIHLVRAVALVLGVGLAATGCGFGGGGGRSYRPIDSKTAKFWDRQTTETRDLLLELARTFNGQREGLPIEVEHIGGYRDIYRKVSASIQAGQLPAMAVAYESMTAEYAQAGAVVDLSQFLSDPELGLSEADLADFYPAVLETNRFEEFGGALYSFPFAKSVLMLYFNKRVLAAADIDAPPQTWDEFLDHCRKVKAATGKFAHAISVDCSTVHGLIFSMGGQILAGGETLYDSPEALQVFKLYETLARERLAFQIPPGTFDDELALAQGEVAYTLRSSSGRTSMLRLMEGSTEGWGMTRIPQADPARPQTVLFGPNIVVFNTTAEQQRIAWEFVRYFTSPEVNVQWALGTGYLPIRKSAAQHREIQALWDEWPYNRAAYDCLEFAKPEPNRAGWQQVRSLVERKLTAIINQTLSAELAARELKQEADEIIKEAARGRGGA